MIRPAEKILNNRIIHFLLIFLIIIKDGFATDYFVSSDGNDMAEGTTARTAWKSISKVNSIIPYLKPGDRILFNRGEVFDGTLNISAYGSPDRPITIGDYGTGSKPVINVFKTLSSWRNEGKGIYSSEVYCESFPNMVTVDGTNTPVGRWPNSGWRTIDSHEGNTLITDKDLHSTPDWDNAEVVIRVSHWIIDRNLIKDHTGPEIRYISSSGNEARDGYGYFIQNHIKTLDSPGEWYYNGSRIYMFFGKTDNPDNHVIMISQKDNLVNISDSRYLILENISFTGANSRIINITGSDFITVQNCDLSFSGGYALYGDDMTGKSSRNLLIRNNHIYSDNTGGIHLENDFLNARITGNIIEDIGTIAGMDGSYVDTGIGIICRSPGVIIEYNRLINIGYIGILFQGAGSVVRFNLIDNFCSVKDDGAGIYTNCQCSQEISQNIILNGKGAPEGTILNRPEAHGIYIDDKGSNTIVSNNTVANNATGGIYLHNAHEITVINNICYNNKFQIYFVHDLISPDDPIRNIKLSGNVFFAKEQTQLTLNFVTIKNDINLFGSSDNNLFIRPLGDNKTISTRVYGWEGDLIYRSLEEWNSYTGQDLNSAKMPESVVDISDKADGRDDYYEHEVITSYDSILSIEPNKTRFEYNSTPVARIVLLDSAYIDVRGIKYINRLELLPFTSTILLPLTL